MSSIWKKLKDILSASDYFNSSNMLRFQKEDDYKTITGGVISMAIIILIIVAFTKEILVTLERTSIQVASNILKNDVPTASHLTFSPQTNGMFALYITGSSPNSDIRYFDVTADVFNFDTLQNGPVSTYTEVNMVACTPAHFEGYQSADGVYQLDRLYCPENGTNFEIFGKLANGKQSNFNLHVTPCNPFKPGAPCATQQQMAFFWMGFGGLMPFSVIYMNTIITPDNPQYKRAYLEDRGYAYIGPSFGSDIMIEMADYIINTDQSIWPFTDDVKDAGLFVPSGISVKSFPKSQMFPYYINIRIKKSTDTYIYQRTVQKLSTVFSYIGGVISSLIAAFFIMNKYTSFSFQISIASEIFKTQDQSQKSDDQAEQAKKMERQKQVSQENSQIPMSILLYFKFNAYNFFKNTLKRDLKSQHLEYLNQCQQQIKKQLDIKRIIKRINCLQHCISNIVEKQKLKTILSAQPAALQQIKKCRQEFEQQVIQNTIQSSKFNQNVNLKIQNQRIIIQDDEFMQPCYSQLPSASGLFKDGRHKNQLIVYNNTQNHQNQRFSQQNNLRRILSQTRNSAMAEKNVGLLKHKKHMISFLNQDRQQYEKQVDICEIPVEFLKN